jgi:hypothetical protein
MASSYINKRYSTNGDRHTLGLDKIASFTGSALRSCTGGLESFLSS